MATRSRGGRRFQVIALVLTYWAVGLAYVPLVFSEMSKKEATEQASTNTNAPVAAPDAPDSFSFPVALAALVGFSLALPVMIVVGSLPSGLISAAIIAFGMQQAWRMTAAPQPQITGPYRIGAGPPALA